MTTTGSLQEPVCESCGIVIEVKATGRRKKRCDPCLKKHRKDYQAHKYRVRASAKVPRVRKVKTLMNTVKGARSNLEELKRYEHTEAFKVLQNYCNREGFAGGSGYNAPFSVPPHLRRVRRIEKSNAVKMSAELKEFLLKIRGKE